MEGIKWIIFTQQKIFENEKKKLLSKKLSNKKNRLKIHECEKSSKIKKNKNI